MNHLLPTEYFCKMVLQEIVERQNRYDKDDSFDLCAVLAKKALELEAYAYDIRNNGWIDILVWNNEIADFANKHWYEINSFTHSLEFEDMWVCIDQKEMTYIKYILTTLDIAWSIVYDEIEQKWNETTSM